MKKVLAQKIEKLEEPYINRKIVVLFLEKVEKLSQEERREILKTIQFINHPRFLVK